MMSASDAVQFFSSVKGRLNRKPYNIVMIISVILITMCSMFLIERALKSSAPILAMKENIKILCSEASNKYSTPGSDIAKGIERCVEGELSKALENSPHNPEIMILGFGSLLLWLVIACPVIRRLHDRGKSGWWYLGFIGTAFIPYLNVITSIWFLIETSFLRGTVGPNDYGPDPLA